MSTATAPDPLREGHALARAGRWAEALPRYEEALARQGETPDLLAALGDAAMALGMAERAAVLFGRAAALRPGETPLLVRRARAEAAMGLTDIAVAGLREALLTRPGDASLWLALGNLLREAGDLAHAEIFLTEAVRLAPGHAAALGSLAEVIADLGRHDDAMALYDRAVSAAPGDPQARLNRGLARLAAGDLRGWEDYEARLRIPARVIARRHRLPRWDGRARRERRLLVMSEQGVGDQMMFAACLPALESGGPVLLECEPRLVPLFARSFPFARVVPHDLEVTAASRTMHYGWLRDAGHADMAIELGSLPLRVQPAGLAQVGPTLQPCTAERARWQQWIAGLGAGPVIGLTWRSGRTEGLRAAEYAPLEHWARLVAASGATLVSIQYGADDQEVATLARLAGRPVHVPPGIDLKHELDRLAALCAALDLVIAAPVATAVLAAGVGTRVLKVHHHRSWTALGRQVEAFYPAAEIVAPARPGDWDSVFAEAARRLTR